MLNQKVREHVPPAFDGRPVLRMFVDPGRMDFYAQVAFPDFGGFYAMPYLRLLRHREVPSRAVSMASPTLLGFMCAQDPS